jgi:hypothetical protein
MDAQSSSKELGAGASKLNFDERQAGVHYVRVSIEIIQIKEKSDSFLGEEESTTMRLQKDGNILAIVMELGSFSLITFVSRLRSYLVGEMTL